MLPKACLLFALLAAVAEVPLIAGSRTFEEAYEGCFEPWYGDGVLKFRKRKIDRFMSPKKCYYFCESFKVYSYFGLKNGLDCYCGHRMHSYARASSDKCQLPCSGYPKELCGGEASMDVYQLDRIRSYLYDSNEKSSLEFATTTPKPTLRPPNPNQLENSRHVGCFKQNFWEYALSTNFGFYYNLTPLVCYNLCYKRRFGFFGVSSGNKCFCDVRLYRTQMSRSCNVPCYGNANIHCGGYNEVDVYAIEKI
ncbi:hypothetical protein BOX15_Mlig027242g2 [Macrostomum lignano]|uniref:WSC domain-containing protein n=2 Tax=Macrostomum lignano TaxID=282301 RepID=A0A1I8JJJ4_9PLAT|nr:hypothetical protein BOX15_Mlig027242g2 [Macrostomum lignano]